MPTYQYKCTDIKCEHSFETIQKMSDKPLVSCPECKAESLKKVITSGNFILKGDGWFNTGGY